MTEPKEEAKKNEPREPAFKRANRTAFGSSGRAFDRHVERDRAFGKPKAFGPKESE